GVAAALDERRADVDADRPETSVVARADAGADLEVAQPRQRRGRDVAGVDERHDPEIADPDPRLQREFGEAPAADRIVEHRVVRPQLLEAVAAHRAAAAGVEAPRRCDPVAAGAEDGAEPGPA